MSPFSSIPLDFIRLLDPTLHFYRCYCSPSVWIDLTTPIAIDILCVSHSPIWGGIPGRTCRRRNSRRWKNMWRGRYHAWGCSFWPSNGRSAAHSWRHTRPGSSVRPLCVLTLSISVTKPSSYVYSQHRRASGVASRPATGAKTSLDMIADQTSISDNYWWTRRQCCGNVVYHYVRHAMGRLKCVKHVAGGTPKRM